VAEITAQHDLSVRIVKKTDITPYEQTLPARIPAVAIDDEVVSEGRVISKEELEVEIKRRLS
jgi:hypothetical protein